MDIHDPGYIHGPDSYDPYVYGRYVAYSYGPSIYGRYRAYRVMAYIVMAYIVMACMAIWVWRT